MKLSDKIRYVGVNDHKKVLFECQWPLPKGVTYNSYLVIGDKIALIDTAAAGFGEEFLTNIKTEIGDKAIDYLIVNHMEPDHSALMSFIQQHYPNIQLYASAKALPMIAGYHGITNNVNAVKDGEILDLGGVSLVFKMTPMVHWPETMMTYCPEEKTLFAGDGFGCFGAVEGKLTDRFEEYKDEMLRYYSNIVGKYGQPVQTALKKLADYKLDRICSTHGPIWEEEINKVVGLYNSLSLYQGEKGVCIVYGSMYGNTEQAAKALEKELVSRGIKVAIHNICFENVSFAYMDAFKYDTIIVGAPTYNNDIFPCVRDFMYGLKSRLLKNRKFAAFGSYTWMGASVKLMNEFAQSMNFDLLSEGISFNQGYSEEKCDIKSLADKIVG